ncbi:MAG: hypothetical protein HY815_09535, partial [Candidatus Riflebacteria bacterium]|nr:hypothetical protein [Candidatus Riflebacteria bacterium]
SLDRAKLSGVSGAELVASRAERLKTQAAFYRQAQLAAGTPADKVQPLYVLLDPKGTWAYAQPWATISYTRDGKKVGPVTAPMLLMGEAMDHSSQANTATKETADVNRQIIEATRAWYAEAVKKGRNGDKAQFDRDVLKSMRLTIGASAPMDLGQVASALPCKSYVEWLSAAVIRDLDSRGLEGKKLWNAHDVGTVARLVQDGQRYALQQEIADTVAHELGHVINFAALGLYGFKGAGTAPHMNGNSHTLATLSTPQFAFVEGWAEANSMVVVGSPKESYPGEANRINYDSTVGVVLKKLNRGTADLLGARLIAAGLLATDKPLTVPPFGSSRDDFMKGLKETATKLGMKDSDWTALAQELGANAQIAHLERARAYVEGLQARKGQPRGRYDFLRSEYAVANVLARLREALGREQSWLVLKTLSSRKPETLAQLLEGFCHDNPALKVSVYKTIARVTDGILVTEQQAAFVEAEATAGRTVEIDIDQDGKVPGTSANGKNPTLFPADPVPGGVQDPLGWQGPVTGLLASVEERADDVKAVQEGDAVTSHQVVVDGPSLAPRVIPPAASPDMDGVEAR